MVAVSRKLRGRRVREPRQQGTLWRSAAQTQERLGPHGCPVCVSNSPAVPHFVAYLAFRLITAQSLTLLANVSANWTGLTF
jgi:hypothetical protein